MTQELMKKNEASIQILIITGYSGAGKSSVLRALEDLGFFCIDNLPTGLLATFFQFVIQSAMQAQKLALGIDIRGGQTGADLVKDILASKNQELGTIKIIFLTASSQILVKRFQETRRKHPLIDPLDLEDAIAYEKELLDPLKKEADMVIDTDQLNIHELRAFISSSFIDLKPKMLVSLISFGFKYGVPVESNFVYDLRALPNPYFVPALKDLDGTTCSVRDYLFAQQEVGDYFSRLADFLKFALEKSYNEGRFFINVAIGCTGGRHRSVAFAQELALLAIDNVQFLVKHRDIHKDIQKS